MSNSNSATTPSEHPLNRQIGAITWVDLTVPNAGKLLDFYKNVVGWDSEPVPMGEYTDFNLRLPGTQDTVAGLCYARGMNKGLPAQWLIYVTVLDLDDSLTQCQKLGGKIISGPNGTVESGRYAVIQDPAGAIMALYTPPLEV